MPIVYNGNTITKIQMNSTNISEVTYNSTKVFEEESKATYWQFTHQSSSEENNPNVKVTVSGAMQNDYDNGTRYLTGSYAASNYNKGTIALVIGTDDSMYYYYEAR